MTSIPDNQPEQDIPPVPEVEPADAASVTASATPEADSTAVPGETSLADDAMTLLSEHKGKLAIGVAATLGMMVYYGWREKRLAKTDPEEYARLQRLKAVVRHTDDVPKARTARKAAARPAEATQAGDSGEPGTGRNDAASTPPESDTAPDKA
ncbi:hypothetical protein KTQ42_12680|uniref:hypothetical protein n=1 Tax=Noviherbaspirillum sp. L7-7A TaxID=2850560 RepID=UPI001C2C2833|nr:hypothetical protein [Noviherbaspirillum sp. L7-7A]MBV0880157.1 hypothetical protein [Noviherbaspirillum sp. L7-7A]